MARRPSSVMKRAPSPATATLRMNSGTNPARLPSARSCSSPSNGSKSFAGSLSVFMSGGPWGVSGRLAYHRQLHRHPHVLRGDPARDVARHGSEGLGLGAVRSTDHHRYARVARLADLQIQGNLPEEGDGEHLRRPVATALVEDGRDVRAVRAHELAHVLHDAEHRDVYLVEHLLGAHHV